MTPSPSYDQKMYNELLKERQGARAHREQLRNAIRDALRVIDDSEIASAILRAVLEATTPPEYKKEAKPCGCY